MCVPLGVRTVRLPSSGRAQIQSIRLSASPERSSAEQTPSCTGVPVCLRETGSGFFGAVLGATSLRWRRVVKRWVERRLGGGS